MNKPIVPPAFQIVPTDIEYITLRCTPALAAYWLGLNVRNRTVKKVKVAAWADDIRAGNWFTTAEPIKFAGPPEAPTLLLDGQNRLEAIRRAGKSVVIVVAFNVPESSQRAMDSGTKRTVADQLTIAGEAHANTVAAAANVALRVAHGKISGGQMPASDVALQDFVADNPAIKDSAALATRTARKSDVPPSIVTYTHFVFSQIDPDEADRFWIDAAEKVGLTAGDPILALTNRVAEARRNREKVNLAVYLSMVYRAWNYRREGRSLKRMKVNSSKGGIIPIPEPK